MARPSTNLTADLRVRMTPEEKAQLVADAARAAVDVSTMARAQLTNAPIPRNARRASNADTEALARILGQLGKVGNNLNQIAHVANGERAVNLAAIRATNDAKAELAEIRAQIRAALEP